MSRKQIELFEKPATDTRGFIARYCELWKDRYGTSPKITRKAAGIAKRLSEDLGKDGVPLLEAYFQMTSRRYLERAFDLVMFEMDLAAIQAFAATGRSITQAQARTVETAKGNLDAVRAYRARQSDETE
jgi:hypothetical protein